jgi:hypothetical protein
LTTIHRFWLLNLLAYAVLALVRFLKHSIAQQFIPDLRTLGQACQTLNIIALLALVSLIITLAQTYCAGDIVGLLVTGLHPADLSNALNDQSP